MIIFLAIFGLAVAVIAYGTLTKSNWGINLRPVDCPHCAARQPMFRRPANSQQAMWGGITCEACGTQMDKWGRQLQPAVVRSVSPPRA
jgi:hypothetical protein